MIKNVVFDFGNVLIKYEPRYIVRKYVTDEHDARLLEEVVFDRLYWDRLDDGGITDEELMARACERLPERLHGIAHTVYYNWVHNLPPVDGMWELAARIKREYGVRLYLLSNISTYFARFESEFAVLAEMEKCIYSACVGHVKPNADMFEYLCSACDILPSETLFIDDNAGNIAGAVKFGIQGYLFDGDAQRLSSYLDGVLSV